MITNVSGCHKQYFDPYPVMSKTTDNDLKRAETVSFLSVDFGWFLVFNATFSNISVKSWRPVLIVEKAWVHRENHRPWASSWWALLLAAVASRVHLFVMFNATRDPTPYWWLALTSCLVIHWATHSNREQRRPLWGPRVRWLLVLQLIYMNNQITEILY